MNYNKFILRYSERNKLTYQIIAYKVNNNNVKIIFKITHGLYIGGLQTTTWYLSDGSNYDIFTYHMMPSELYRTTHIRI